MAKTLTDTDFWFYLTKHNSTKVFTDKEIAIALDQAICDYEEESSSDCEPKEPIRDESRD